MEIMDLDYRSMRRVFSTAAVRRCTWRKQIPYGIDDLSVALAYKGAADAPKVEDAASITVLISGTHGIEGPAGGYLQTQLLSDGTLESLPSRSGVLFVHGLNPWGWVHERRVDDKNVDVNRSCGPVFATVSRYHNHALILEPRVWNDHALQRLLAVTRQDAGYRELNDAMSGGQFENPNGLFYGGRELSRSACILRDEVFPLLRCAERIGVIDIHSGLGPNGVGTLISPATDRDSALARRTRSMFDGPFDFPLANVGGALASPVSGDVLSFFLRSFPDKTVIPIALEMGVRTPGDQAIALLIAENALHHNPDAHADEDARRIRGQFRELFTPDELGWWGNLYARGRAVTDAMIRGL
jgi:hypothetical protein